ncbi:hypothetical protein [Paraburkholderia xenovorans]|jgi:hypothetical protein
MNRLSQRDVMKLRPHPGTTILFCAIKENPRRKFAARRFATCGRSVQASRVFGATKQSGAARALWHRANTKKWPCYQGHM